MLCTIESEIEIKKAQLLFITSSAEQYENFMTQYTIPLGRGRLCVAFAGLSIKFIKSSSGFKIYLLNFNDSFIC